ncbi:RNA polymerase sigma factor RpoD/SigA [Salibacter sp.]|uniref:sigma-70 family RNA polymerase sigma factor n=1 Tax=Salibacter sp. TaxID=2010995 RepID=UPI002870034F|nr:RNA polymerase sigma factor RpoD/SigA [Salibacter sp.]MDR9397752.1 RNA polymerase sigma factor RpoD/SigA [Salibacter sp.]MDR9487216.1 RNA polymerase sigma factor RpoD/SigA [Salibacter sp.]
MRQLRITKQITNRESVSLDKYLQEISKETMLSADQEVELAQRIQNGDATALEKLTKANLRFVVSVAKQYQNQGLTLPDLINEGNLGLIKAAKRFDQTRGFKFISYAVWWIRQSILKALAEQSRMVRLPLNKIGSISKVNKAYSELEQLHQRKPSTSEIADMLEISEAEVKQSQRINNRHISMDAPILGDDSDDRDMYARMEAKDGSPDKQLLADSLKEEVAYSLNFLAARESQVIKLYFGIGYEESLTLEEVGDKLALTRERVRQIKERALRRLKVMSRNAHLKSFLG